VVRSFRGINHGGQQSQKASRKMPGGGGRKASEG